jgi:hypothetical protein
MAYQTDTNADKRADIGATVGISSYISGAFRKDHLNVVLSYLGGDSVDSSEVYGHGSPSKEWFYENVADAAGFDYPTGQGENARPFNSTELELLRGAVNNADAE